MVWVFGSLDGCWSVWMCVWIKVVAVCRFAAFFCRFAVAAYFENFFIMYNFFLICRLPFCRFFLPFLPFCRCRYLKKKRRRPWFGWMFGCFGAQNNLCQNS
jgi:hypothetical protein